MANSNLATGNNTAEPRLFISNYYTLVNNSIFFKFELPSSLDMNLLEILIRKQKMQFIQN